MNSTIFNLILFLGLTSLASAAQKSVTLSLAPSSITTVTKSSSSGGSDTGSLTYSGEIEVDLVFDDTTFSPQMISLNGGRVLVSDNTLSFDTTGQNPLTQAPLNVTVLNSTSGIVRLFDTPISLQPVAPDTGLLIAARHRETLDRGRETLTVSSSVFPGIGSSETTSYSLQPVESTARGMLSVSISENSPGILTVTLTQVLNESQNDDIQDIGVSLTTTETGTITATGTIVLAGSPLSQWAIANGLGENPDLIQRNQAGVPYGILFAFNLPITAAEVPMTFESSSSGIKGRITLPDAGSGATLIPEYSTTLLAGSWSRFPASSFDDGEDSLNAGQRGIRTLTLPDDRAVFIRLSASF